MTDFAEAVWYDPILNSMKQVLSQGSKDFATVIDQHLDLFSARYNYTRIEDEALRHYFRDGLMFAYGQSFNQYNDVDQALVALRNQVGLMIKDLHFAQMNKNAEIMKQKQVVNKQDPNDAKVVTVTMVCHLGDQYGAAPAVGQGGSSVSVDDGGGASQGNNSGQH